MRDFGSSTPMRCSIRRVTGCSGTASRNDLADARDTHGRLGLDAQCVWWQLARRPDPESLQHRHGCWWQYPPVCGLDSRDAPRGSRHAPIRLSFGFSPPSPASRHEGKRPASRPERHQRGLSPRPRHSCRSCAPNPLSCWRRLAPPRSEDGQNVADPTHRSPAGCFVVAFLRHHAAGSQDSGKPSGQRPTRFQEQAPFDSPGSVGNHVPVSARYGVATIAIATVRRPRPVTSRPPRGRYQPFVVQIAKAVSVLVGKADHVEDIGPRADHGSPPFADRTVARIRDVPSGRASPRRSRRAAIRRRLPRSCGSMHRILHRPRRSVVLSVCARTRLQTRVRVLYRPITSHTDSISNSCALGAC